MLGKTSLSSNLSLSANHAPHRFYRTGERGLANTRALDHVTSILASEFGVISVLSKSERNRRYYLANRERLLLKKRHELDLINTHIREVKSQPCMDCGGFFHFSAMQFDHRPDEVKSFEIGSTWARGWKLDRIIEEIQKCDLVCANCHAVRTYMRRSVAQSG